MTVNIDFRQIVYRKFRNMSKLECTLHLVSTSTARSAEAYLL